MHNAQFTIHNRVRRYGGTASAVAPLYHEHKATKVIITKDNITLLFFLPSALMFMIVYCFLSFVA